MQDAVGCARCVAILARGTSFELLKLLWPVALGIVWLIRGFRRGEITSESMQRFECRLEELLREGGRRVVEWTVNRLEPDDRLRMRPQWIWQGDYYRLGGRSPVRSLSCLFGPIRLTRFWYRPLESAGRCLFPLQVALGIVNGVATPALADRVARLSVDLTQREVLKQLRPLGIFWGVGTLRKLQQAMAERLEEFQHPAQVAQVLAWLHQASKQSGPRRLAVSVGRDGIMLPIVKTPKYREAATATLSVMDRSGRRVGTVYLGRMPEFGQGTLSDQLTRLLTDVLGAWTGPLPRLVYVTDAGHHPTAYFEDVLSRLRHPRTGALLEWEWIVDYYHACQYVTQLAESIFGPGRDASAWAGKMRRWLKTKPGGVHRVLRSAGALLTRRGLIGGVESYCRAYNYLRDRAGKMDYARWQRLKLPIGSGVTEAACKILFTQRFKQSGMKWTVEGGAAILTLRTIALSGIWDEVRAREYASQRAKRPTTPHRSAFTKPFFPKKIAA
ncbi:MAG TPA: hypothetical protein VM165_11280 [Planctomycetaceae bacterium]|nr:hypothetical protein [Planctomycetaceae bacterium]